MPYAITLSDAIDGFTQHLTARGLTKSTVKNHRQILHRALTLWGNIQVQSIQPRHIDRLFQDGAWAPATQNLYLGYLRAFFTWARGHGYMHRDAEPTVGWRNLRVPRVERAKVPVEDFDTLLDGCDHPRDRIAVALGLYTFMRVSEIITLRVSDVDLAACTITMYRHKTKEEDTLPVCEELREELVRWFNWYRQDQQGRLMPHWLLVPAKEKDDWIGVEGTLVRTGTVAHVKPERKVHHPWQMAQRALTRYGIVEKHTGGHTLRRSGARALFDALREQGYDGALMRVSSMLGHADVKITQRYLGIGLERQQRNDLLAGKRMFPAKGGAVLKVVNDG